MLLGTSVGVCVGNAEGAAVGARDVGNEVVVGATEEGGGVVGAAVGVVEVGGSVEGNPVGCGVGGSVGVNVGTTDGCSVGVTEVGATVATVGVAVVGVELGAADGEYVGGDDVERLSSVIPPSFAIAPSVTAASSAFFFEAGILNTRTTLPA
jgi:hypothetical protein